MTTFIDSVEISGAKAISGTIKIDLRSPLVVLYAPNGTGKTSVWSAISALIGDRDDDQLKCRVTTASPLRIFARLRTQGGAFEAIRSGNNPLRLEPVIGPALTGTEALKLIAPECSLDGMQTKGPAIKRRLQEHIRSTRSLPSDSLSYLIDDSNDSIELRRQIFADLTGTSELQVEQRELRSYIERLSRWRDERSREKNKREADYTVQKNAGGTELADIGKLLSETALSLDVSIENLDENETLALLRSSFSSKFAEFEIRRKRTEDARSAIAQRSVLPSLEDLAKELADNTGAVEATQSSLSRNLLAAQAKSNQITDTRTQDIKLSSLLLFTEENIADIVNQSSISHTTSIGELRRQTSERSREIVATSISRIQQRMMDIQAYQPLAAQETSLAAQLAKTIDAAAQIGSLDELRSEAQRLEAEIYNISKNKGKLEKLRLDLADAARQILSAEPTNVCPCCSHKWPSAESLVEAIEAMLGQKLVDDERFKLLSDTRHALVEKISALTKLQGDLSRITGDLNSLRQKKHAFELRLSQSHDLPSDAAQLQTLLDSEHATELMFGLLDAMDEAIVEQDQNVPLGSLLNHLRMRKQKLASSLIELEADLNFLRNEEHRLSALLEEGRKSRTLIEQKISDARLLDEKLSEFSLAFGSDASMTAELQKQQAKLPHEEKIFLNARELLNQITNSLSSARSRKLAADIMIDLRRLEAEVGQVNKELEQANHLLDFISQRESEISGAFFTQLGPAIGTLFNHMQVNRIFSDINIDAAQQSFSLTGSIDNADAPLAPVFFSQGQRQDLALAMFLARACTLGGSYFLDEPLLHLDDLNRTALLDCIRACVIGTHAEKKQVKLLITTANWSVARQFIQKFSNVRIDSSTPALTVYGLSGNVNIGVDCEKLFASESAPLQ